MKRSVGMFVIFFSFVLLVSAFAQIDLKPPPKVPTPAEVLAGIRAGATKSKIAAGITSSFKASIDSEPTSLNLALSGIANACGYYPQQMTFPGATESFLPTPDCANNASPLDCWASDDTHSYHWLLLTWAEPQTINRVILYGIPLYGQTVRSIQYFDANTQSYVTIPNTSKTFGGPPTPPTPPDLQYADFTFAPVQTQGIVAFLNTGPSTPNPAGVVFLSEMEAYKPFFEVKSVTPNPSTIWLDKAGAGTGIEFKAITTEPTQSESVTFKVVSPSGGEFIIGSIPVTKMGSDWGARLFWSGRFPNSAVTESGLYSIVAETGASKQQSTFTVKKVNGYIINMGPWMINGKDPIVAIPEEPTKDDCPPKPWDEIVSTKPGYFTGLSAGDPVNIVSGNFAFSETDHLVKSRESLVLARIYNSLDAAVTPFGRGWSSPYFSHLEFIASDVLFINSDGSRLLFKQQGTQFIGPDETDLKLSIATETGFWFLKHPFGLEWSFSSDGKIIRLAKTCCGRGAADAILLDYDSNGHLHRVTNSIGQWLECTSNPAGQITRITDSFGRVLQYSYDSHGHLLAFTDPIGRITVYSYTEDGLLTQVQKPGNRITGITYTDLRVSTVTAPDGGVSRYAWDFVSPQFTLTDPTGVIHEYSFTPDWRFTSYAVPSLSLHKNFTSSGSALIGFQNSLGANQSFQFNASGLLAGKTDVLGNTSRYEYHPTFHKLTNSRGFAASFAGDGRETGCSSWFAWFMAGREAEKTGSNP